MRYFFGILAITTLVLLAVAGQVAAAENGRTLTGIVDERPGSDYVLRDESNMQLRAILRPSGGKPQIFAKFVGQRVEVRGRVISDSGTPVIEVSDISRLAPKSLPTAGAADRIDEPLNALTGMLMRQSDGSYALRDRFTGNVIATLAPSAAARSQLAEYRGKKVLVEGRLRRGKRAPVLTVEKIEPFPE